MGAAISGSIWKQARDGDGAPVSFAIKKAIKSIIESLEQHNSLITRGEIYQEQERVSTPEFWKRWVDRNRHLASSECQF